MSAFLVTRSSSTCPGCVIDHFTPLKRVRRPGFESCHALDAIQEIASVPGLLSLLVGPFDLSVAIGLDGDRSHPRAEEALERVVEAAARGKVPLVMPLFHPSSDDCESISRRADIHACELT